MLMLRKELIYVSAVKRDPLSRAEVCDIYKFVTTSNKETFLPDFPENLKPSQFLR